MKYIFLFGAGASLYNHILPEIPPLANQLFERLVTKYPNVWGAIPEEFAGEFRVNFEQGILRVMESNSHLISPLMQTMALYFASFSPDNSNSDLYSVLIKRMQNEGVLNQILFSTLNYECLFEIACSRQGLQVHYNDIPPPSGTVVVWKLHGSCNFKPDPKEISMRRGGSYAWGMTINVRLIPVSPSEIIQWLQGDTALYPAMCMFTLNKPSQISPGIFAERQHKWGALVNAADKVMVIGVRPNIQDEHIWQPLAVTGAKLHFVGNESQLNAWLPRRIGGETNFMGSTFEATIDKITEELAN